MTSLSVVANEAGASRVRHEEGIFDGTDGVRLFEQSWRPEGNPKAVLVIVHGLKDYSGHYEGAATALARRGYAVHAFDLRGHGRSEGERVFVDAFSLYHDLLHEPEAARVLADMTAWMDARVAKS